MSVTRNMITQLSIECNDQLDSYGIFIDATLDPSYSLPSTFFDALQWETHLVCETQVALNDTALFVRAISVFVKYHTTHNNMSRMCAGLRRLRHRTPYQWVFPTTYEVIVVERRNCDKYTIPQIPRLDFKQPPKTVPFDGSTVPYLENLRFPNSGMFALFSKN